MTLRIHSRGETSKRKKALHQRGPKPLTTAVAGFTPQLIEGYDPPQLATTNEENAGKGGRISTVHAWHAPAFRLYEPLVINDGSFGLVGRLSGAVGGDLRRLRILG